MARSKKPAATNETELDSDFLDEDEEQDEKPKKLRRSAAKSKKRKVDSEDEEEEAPAPKAKRRRRQKDKDDYEDEDEEDDEEAVVYHGDIVRAPTTGLAPPGQISQHTLDFLKRLKDPECNDREWFKRHEPIYRHVESEWKSFIESFTDDLVEIDDEIPPLPPKDVIHRIYRDVRFSNNKTPYKTNFSASFSRSGRKGIFAGYHLSISSDGRSLLAGGTWCPGKSELQTLRANIMHDSSRLRTIISSPEFEQHFGSATPRKTKEKEGEDYRQSNIFGHDDELKTAPKGVAKDHPEIDLLKCRSFFVVHRFQDEDVVGSEFREKVGEVIRAVMPFVHCLNDMMTIRPDEDDDDGEE